jgi:hypothetical protein
MNTIPPVELYKQLENNFIVAVDYHVGSNKELSSGVLEIIQHLKGNLSQQDILPSPTSLTVVLKNKEDNKIIDTFHQSSQVYMEAFDSRAFEEFAESNLIDFLSGVEHRPYQEKEKINN